MSNFFLIAITIIAWGIGSIFYKIANDSIHPIMVSSLVTSLYVMMIPVGILFFKIPISFNFNGIVCGLLGGLCMCIGSLCYFFALQKGGAGEVTALTSIYPALTLLLSIYFLKENISLSKIIGLIVMIIGIFIFSKR